MDHNLKAFIAVKNQDTLATIGQIFDETQNQYTLANNAEDAKTVILNQKFDFIIIEQDYPDLNPAILIQELRKNEVKYNLARQTPVFIFGEDAKQYYQVFHDITLCKYIPIAIDSSKLSSAIYSFLANLEENQKKVHHLTKGEFLIKEGSESGEMYWIISGKLNITKTNNAGENIVIGEAGPGELVGEMSFLESLPRSASVKAIEESDVIVIPHDQFLDLFETQPLWFRSLMRILSKRLRSANQVIAQNRQHSDAEVELDQDDIDKLIQQGLTEGI